MTRIEDIPTVSDTICVPVVQLRKIIRDNMDGRVAIQEAKTLAIGYKTLKMLDSVQQLHVASLMKKDTTMKLTLLSKDETLRILTARTDYTEKLYKDQLRVTLREKRKKTLFKITTGIALVAAMIFKVF